MSVVTLTPIEYAEKLRVCDAVQLPCPIGGYLYMVIRGTECTDIFRVSIA